MAGSTKQTYRILIVTQWFYHRITHWPKERAFQVKLLPSSTDLVLSHIRQHFWIIQGRQTVKEISRLCPQCIKQKAKPGQLQMRELPRERMEAYAFPFTRTPVYYYPREVGYGRIGEKKGMELSSLASQEPLYRYIYITYRHYTTTRIIIDRWLSSSLRKGHGNI